MTFQPARDEKKNYVSHYSPTLLCNEKESAKKGSKWSAENIKFTLFTEAHRLKISLSYFKFEKIGKKHIGKADESLAAVDPEDIFSWLHQHKNSHCQCLPQKSVGLQI